MTTLLLPGMRPNTLAGYLGALGLFRTVRRALDGRARASWDGCFVLHSHYSTVDELVDALLDGYAPEAVVSPWNAGAGFTGNGKNATAESQLEWVRSSTMERLAGLRAAVAAGDEVISEARSRGLVAADGTLAKDAKQQILLLCGNTFPDAALPWFEAATTLHGEDEVAYSRLLGTGGNFGRQDLCATYLSRVRTVFTDPERADAWLRSLISGAESVPYLRDTVGQFDPGRAGGIQSSIMEKIDDKGFVNPWAFLFAVEGTLLFASAVSRTQGSQRSRAVLPFQVRGSTSGYPHAAGDERPLGELWAPEWSASLGGAELRQLLSEGRATWNGHDAATGLDFVRAVATLGIDRSVRAFHRFLFVERLGQNPLAVHGGRVPVVERAGVRSLAGLDPWRNRMYGDLPAGAGSALRRLDDAIFQHARTGHVADLVELFVELGRAHNTVARSDALREKVSPLVLDSGRELLARLYEQKSDVDLRIALSLATARDVPAAAARWSAWLPTLRPLLSPVTADKAGRISWTDRPVPVAFTGDLRDTVLAAARLRAQAAPENDVFSAPETGNPAAPGVRGALIAFTSGTRLSPKDLELFGAGLFDQERAALLLSGLLCANWQYFREPRTANDNALTDAGLRMLSLFALPRPITVTTDGAQRRTVLRANRSWPTLLRAGRTEEVLADAARRLRLAGFRHVVTPHSTAHDGALAAALLLPPQTTDSEAILSRLTAGTDSISYERPAPFTQTTGHPPAENPEEIPA